MGETLDKDLVVKSTRHRVLAWGNRLFDDDEKGYQFTAATFGIMRVKNAYFEDGTPEAEQHAKFTMQIKPLADLSYMNKLHPAYADVRGDQCGRAVLGHAAQDGDSGDARPDE